MRSYIQKGDVMPVTAAGAIASGDVVVTGALAGIAACDAALGESVEVSLTGVYAVPVASAIAQGTRVYYDPENKVATASADDGGTPATAFPALGYAFAASGAEDAVIAVRLWN